MRWAAAFCLLAFPAASRAQEQPLNVVIVDVCSARADHFGVYGYDKPTTPKLDETAKESAVFDRALSQSSWCLPNYASLLTGHVPEVHGLYTNVPFRALPKFEKTMPERLKYAGYRTAAFTGDVYFFKAWGLNRGFDTFVNSYSTSEALPGTLDKNLPGMLRWIDRQKGRPFFVYATVDDLHSPYQADDPAKFDPDYAGVADDTATLSVGFYRAFNGEPASPEDQKRLEAFRKDPRALKHIAARYDASLNRVDREIDELIAGLKKRGLWDKSLVIVTADHGEELGEKGLLGHTESLYEGVLHVPLIIHDPAHPETQGRRLGGLVERVDLMPTVLDAANAPYSPSEFSGRSLAPLLSGSPGPWRDFAFAASKRNAAAASDLLIEERVARSERWKLIWHLYKDHYELYDLEKDPRETKDVSAAHPDVVSKLSFELMKQVERDRPHAPGPISDQDAAAPPKLEVDPARR